MSLDVIKEIVNLQNCIYNCRRDQKRQEINPLEDTRYTLINGKLIIHNPQDTVDNGDYQCVAQNEFGSVLSNSVTLSFGCKIYLFIYVESFLCYWFLNVAVCL